MDGRRECHTVFMIRITVSILLALSGTLRAEGFAAPENLFNVNLTALRHRAAGMMAPQGSPALDRKSAARSLSGLFCSSQMDARLLSTGSGSAEGISVETSGTDDYRIGDEMGKKPVIAAGLNSGSEIFRRTAKAAASYGGGTAFYLGKFNGHHMMATNHHVGRGRCRGSVHFTMLKKSYACEQVYGDWQEVDVNFFSVKVPAEDEAELLPLGRNFAFDASIYTGQELLTIGFGVANNPRGVMMANQDSDCKVFSATDEFRQIMDPDEINPGGYAAWSFVNGCDVSHGDSGSAFVDRKTGDVLGIIWTGKIPKSTKVASSSYLDQMLRTRSPEIWTELSFCVPAVKIRERVQKELGARPGDGDWARTMGAIIARPALQS